MKNNNILFVLMLLATTNGIAQRDGSSGEFWHPKPRNYDVKHAIEVESLVPMFFTGGYHFAVGYRYKKFRVRASVINGGAYDAEKAGLKNSSPDFKRYYTTLPGVFLGYNVWKNLELYTYLEFQPSKLRKLARGKQKM